MGTRDGGAGGHSVITSNFTMKIEQLKARLGEKVQLVSGGKKYKNVIWMVRSYSSLV